MIRKFSLTNAKGTTWSFNSTTIKSFMQNPEGLGFTTNFGYTRYGEKANLTSQQYEFPKVSGQLLFWDSENKDRYKLYNDFVAFIMETPLTLSYQLPLTTPATYTLDC